MAAKISTMGRVPAVPMRRPTARSAIDPGFTSLAPRRYVPGWWIVKYIAV